MTTFILGSLTPTAEISLFCRATAIALALCYVFTLLLFLPILCYCSRFENPNKAAMSRDPNSRVSILFPVFKTLIPIFKAAKLERLYDRVSIAYCRWVMRMS